MDFQITSRHMELTDGLKSHASQIISRLGKEFDNIISIHLIMSVEKHLHVAQVEVRVPGGDFLASEKSDDMYSSIDRATKKIESQLRKEIKRRYDSKRRTPVAEEITPFDESEEDTEDSEFPR